MLRIFFYRQRARDSIDVYKKYTEKPKRVQKRKEITHTNQLTPSKEDQTLREQKID